MNYRTPTTAGVGVGAIGVAVTGLATVLLAVIPDYPWASTAAARTDAILRWSGLVMTGGEVVLVFGLPLLSAVLAASLTASGHTPRRVLWGFVVGGLVFGLGVALLGETVTALLTDDPALGRSLVGHAVDVVGRGGRVVVGALVGVCCALVVERR